MMMEHGTSIVDSHLIVRESTSLLWRILRVEHAGGSAAGDDLVPDRVPDTGLLRRVDDVELSRVVELEPNLGVLLGPRDVACGLEVAPAGGLAGRGRLPGHLHPDEGVVGAVHVHVQAEGDEVVVDDADHVLGEQGAVHVLVLPGLLHVGVRRGLNHEDPAQTNLHIYIYIYSSAICTTRRITSHK
jgi:hypothetical protein